ncbi:MAG: ATP-binding protein [Pseudomonadota bacterium]
MAIGYIHDWRSALAYGAAASLLLIGLYQFVNVDPELTTVFSITPAVQRLLQAQFALLLSTTVAVNFSHNTYFSMTQLEQSLGRAKRAEAAKSEFLATMSHELRTPLNGVIGMAEALAASNLGARERELAQVIRRSGESLLVIIGDLLDLSKIEAGKLMIENGPYSIQGLANHTIESWRAASEMKGVDINAVIDEDVPPLVLGDEHRVGQILDNLISNAVKFTTEGSIEMTVRVSEKKRNPHVVMRVQDTGKGVPAGLENQIFEAFEQGEQGTTRRFGGTGLGLPICKKLAQLMDGDIVLERTGPSGSIFRLTMPLEIAPDEPTTAEEAGLEPSEVLHGARVLVAEDNEVNRMVMHEFLTKWGCETVFAHDGPSTLEALEVDRFDVLLLDKHMPGMGGPEVAVTIRKADKPYRSIPIIAVSADTLSGEREEAMAVGMDDYVPKPVRSHVLRETMERVISSHRAAIGDLGFNREMG